MQLSTLATYQGWASMGQSCTLGSPATTYRPPASPHAAWRWSGTSWQYTTLAAGTRVYIWPYAVGWSWAWTAQTGWLAVRDESVTVNYHCPLLYAN